MRVAPLFLTLTMLTLITAYQALAGFPVQINNRYAALINPMQLCHQAFVGYLDKNPAASGVIAKSLVDAYLPPGVSDPGIYTYLATPPGTADTYVTVPAAAQNVAMAALRRFSEQNAIAGFVANGQIILNATSRAAAAGVPNGVVVIQTIVRNN